MAPEVGEGGTGPARLAGTAGLYFAMEAIGMLATVGGVAAFTRIVPPAIYGQFALVLAASGVAMAVTGEWLQVTALRFTSPGVERSTAVRALLDLLGYSLSLFVVLAAGTAFLFHERANSGLIVLGALFAALSLSFLTVTSLFQANLEARQFAGYRAAYSVLRILLATALALTWERSAAALVGGQALALAVLLPFAIRHVARGLRPQESHGRVQQRGMMLRFGLPLVGWYAASQLLNLSDRFFLQHWRGNTEVGLYAVTYALVMGVVAGTLQPILSAVYPHMVRAWRHGGAQGTQDHFATAVRMFLLLAPGLLGLLWFFGNDLLGILAPESYQTPRLLIGIVAAGVLCWYGGLYIQKALELDLRSRSLLRTLWTAALLNFVANLVLIPLLGMLGASAATLFGYGAYLLLTLRAAGRSMRVPIPPRLLTSALLAFGALAAAGLLADASLATASNWLHLLAGGPFVTATYVLVLVARGEHRLAAK